MREASKESTHGRHVRDAGNRFTPLVFESYGAMGARAVEWFRRMIASAHIEAETEQEEDRLRGLLSVEYQRRLSWPVHCSGAMHG